MSRINPVSKRRRKRDLSYPAARLAVFERSDGACEVMQAEFCNGRCEQVHHIEGRGGLNPHRLDNLYGVCRECHDLIHAQPEWARSLGFMRSRLGGNAA